MIEVIVDERVEKFAKRLRQERAFFWKKIAILQKMGTTLKEPHVRHVRGKLWELRFSINGRKIRVFYFLQKPGTIVLLHAIVKKYGKTRTKDIDIAMRRIKFYQWQCRKQNRYRADQTAAVF